MKFVSKRLKIVIPLISFEEDFLKQGNLGASSNLFGLYKKMFDHYKEDIIPNAYFKGAKGDKLASGAKGLPAVLFGDGSDPGLLKGALNPALFYDLILMTMKEALTSAYGKKLTTIFDPTIKEILSQIGIANSTTNKDWKTDSDVTAESPFSGDSADDDGFDYAPLIAAMLPIAIQGLATFADPAWRTPWFYPGPQTPLGFLAKILKPF